MSSGNPFEDSRNSQSLAAFVASLTAAWQNTKLMVELTGALFESADESECSCNKRELHSLAMALAGLSSTIDVFGAQISAHIFHLEEHEAARQVEKPDEPSDGESCEKLH